jgi:phosphate transport system substrate-binding protein
MEGGVVLKKIFASLIIASVAITALISAGCDSKETAEKTSGQLSGTLKVGGSTTVLPLAQAAAEEFMADNPDVNIEVQGTGSSEGITGVMEGTLDIGNSSRELKDEETGLVDHKVAVDVVAFVVNPGNKVSNLTKQQVINIMTGKVTDWKDVGGTAGEIQVVGRDEASGTREFVQKEVIGKDAKFVANALAMPGTGQLKAAVAQTPGGIGYMSVGQVDDTVKVIKIDGVVPTPETVEDESYAFFRYLHMFTKGEAKGLAKAFIDYIMTKEFQEDTVSEEFYPVVK